MVKKYTDANKTDPLKHKTKRKDIHVQTSKKKHFMGDSLEAQKCYQRLGKARKGKVDKRD